MRLTHRNGKLLGNENKEANGSQKWEIICGFLPQTWEFFGKSQGKNVTEIRKFWEIKMEHIFFPVLEIKCIFSQNMGNYMKTIVKDPLPSPKPQNQLFPFRSHLH